MFGIIYRIINNNHSKKKMGEPVVSHHHLVVKVWPMPKTARSVLCLSGKENGVAYKEEDMFRMTVHMDNVWFQLAFG